MIRHLIARLTPPHITRGINTRLGAYKVTQKEGWKRPHLTNFFAK